MSGITRRIALAAGAGLALFPTQANGEQGDSSLAHRLHQRCDHLQREDNFSGAVMLLKNGRTLSNRVYGLRNRAEKLPVTSDTRFSIASIGKLFTSLSMMRFAQAGAINLDAPLVDAWPDYPDRSVAERITLGQVLTHTAGLGNTILFKPKTGLTRMSTQHDYLRLFASEGLAGEPGGEPAYSNDGYILLGALIERLSGQDFREHCRTTIFEPLGMARTGFFAPDDIVPNMALPYVRDLSRPGVWQSALATDGLPGGAFGGALSTAGDITRFGAAMAANTLLSPAWAKAWTQGRVPMRGAQYGYGMEVTTINSHRAIGHTGGHFGVAGELLIFPNSGHVFVVLSNCEVEPYWDIDQFIRSQIAGEDDGARNYAFTHKLIDVIAARGLEAGIALSADRGRSPREGVIDAYAFRAWHRGDARGAENLLQYNLNRFPDSLSALWSLAEFYRHARRSAEAVAAYQAYLDRQPGDEDAQRYIAELG